MKIAGYMSFYDESPHWLATAVAGMARVCDFIIAHDGAYALYPGARHRSHPQQAEAIIQAADAAEVACLLYRPGDLYHGNEVEKRNHGLRFVDALLTPDEDWFFVFDADYHVMQMHPEFIRAKLAQTEHDVATYTILDGKDLLSMPALAQFAKERAADYEWTIKTRDIYRWTPTLRIGPSHWSYSRTDDSETRWLRGPHMEKNAPALDLEADLVVYHRNQDRAQVRRQAAAVYYDRRTTLGIENEPAVVG